jgi:nitrogen fixation NifU-like protein
MNREDYLETLLDYYENPRNNGTLEDAQLHASGSNPGCGDVVSMYARLDAENHLAEVRFEGQGCTISQAAASLLTELVQGKTLAELECMNADDLSAELGPELLKVRPRCATLGLSVLKNAARDYLGSPSALPSDCVR